MRHPRKGKSKLRRGGRTHALLVERKRAARRVRRLAKAAQEQPGG